MTLYTSWRIEVSYIALSLRKAYTCALCVTLHVLFQDQNADDLPSKMLKALNNMKIKIPGKDQAEADSIYQQVHQQTCRF